MRESSSARESKTTTLSREARPLSKADGLPCMCPGRIPSALRKLCGYASGDAEIRSLGGAMPKSQLTRAHASGNRDLRRRRRCLGEAWRH